MSIDKTYISSPLGTLEIISTPGAIFSVLFNDQETRLSEEIPASATNCVNGC
jgi:hypothetical protein